jgi:hypothetical protein
VIGAVKVTSTSLGLDSSMHVMLAVLSDAAVLICSGSSALWSNEWQLLNRKFAKHPSIGPDSRKLFGDLRGPGPAGDHVTVSYSRMWRQIRTKHATALVLTVCLVGRSFGWCE